MMTECTDAPSFYQSCAYCDYDDNDNDDNDNDDDDDDDAGTPIAIQTWRIVQEGATP